MAGILNNNLSLINQEDFNFLLKNGKRSSKLLNFDFESLIFNSFGFVKQELPDLLNGNDFEKLFLWMFKDRGVFLFSCDIEKISNADAMAFVLWIIDEVKSISELEMTYLQSSPDVKMIQAGIDKLNKFGILNTLDHLAGGDVLKYEKIKKLPYNVVFDKQYMEITKNEIEKKLAKIK